MRLSAMSRPSAHPDVRGREFPKACKRFGATGHADVQNISEVRSEEFTFPTTIGQISSPDSDITHPLKYMSTCPGYRIVMNQHYENSFSLTWVFHVRWQSFVYT